MSKPANELGLIGRDDVLVKAMAARTLGLLSTRYEHTKLHPVHRGYSFDVKLVDRDGAPTGHIVTITTTLDHVESTRRDT